VTGLANSPMNQSAFPPPRGCSGTRASSTGAASLRRCACPFLVGAAGYWHYVGQTRNPRAGSDLFQGLRIAAPLCFRKTMRLPGREALRLRETTSGSHREKPPAATHACCNLLVYESKTSRGRSRLATASHADSTRHCPRCALVPPARQRGPAPNTLHDIPALSLCSSFGLPRLFLADNSAPGELLAS
jgi:hypothetical protein